MAIWKDSDSKKKDAATSSRDRAAEKDEADRRKAETDGVRGKASGRVKGEDSTESVIAGDLTIEGKIEGAGHVRLIGTFKGDVQVEGDLTIEPGAKVSGGVRAEKVVVGGELEGNIDAATSVRLLESGVVNGDVKADSVSVAAGSRMRGQVEFGWKEEELRSKKTKLEPVSTNE
ncbi:MAG: polymer-forming cytoskeletal protein [Gemmatimonadota bacterium]|nr:polymer-forming cytoskeletal protein [Gemmatimonadota bacterium]